MKATIETENSIRWKFKMAAAAILEVFPIWCQQAAVSRPLLTDLHQISYADTYYSYGGYRGLKYHTLEIQDGCGRHLG